MGQSLGRAPARAAIISADINDGIITSTHIADDTVLAADIADDAVGIAELAATGTASSSTFLRGDNTWTAVVTDLVGDSTPQLGGALDAQGNNITDAGNIETSTTKKIKQKAAFMQSSTHQALTLGY